MWCTCNEKIYSPEFKGDLFQVFSKVDKMMSNVNTRELLPKCFRSALNFILESTALPLKKHETVSVQFKKPGFQSWMNDKIILNLQETS